MTPLEWVHLPNNTSGPTCEAMACKNRVFVSTRVEAAKLPPSSVAPATELLDTTTIAEVSCSLSLPRHERGEQRLLLWRPRALLGANTGMPNRLRRVFTESTVRVNRRASSSSGILPSHLSCADVHRFELWALHFELMLFTPFLSPRWQWQSLRSGCLRCEYRGSPLR